MTGTQPGAAAATLLEGNVARPPQALYLHVPFCVSHCPYCDFVVVAGREARGPSNRIAAFTDALATEVQLRADALDATWGPPAGRPPLASVYLGGGTPSLLPASSISSLLDVARGRFGLGADAEFTLEVNPGPDERGDAIAQVAAGVTRLSIGAQSFVPEELRVLGRRHTPEDIRATVAAARRAGARSISLDLLYDVPGQTERSWARSVEAALALDPDHLSLYALTLDDPDAEGLTGGIGDHLPTSTGARQWRARARAGQDDDRAAALYAAADQRLAAAGLPWYEISNWARPGHASRHNLAYWEGGAWEAVGPGAHAFDGVTRRWNAARLDSYLGALAPRDGGPPRLPPGGGEPAVAAEGEITALRTSTGLPAAALDTDRGPVLRWGLDQGLLEAANDRLVLTRRGRLLSNELFARLV
ncbi:MAG TPA: coproporphyrinogen-III oxidase family protein [Candidatus Limnocylindrales bacterium]|nr:coproporphyrinogen-III oxidase family protein [Candidatus Limnocylindrales bacterium]